MTIDDESYSEHRPWGEWGRPERTELVPEDVQELRKGKVLLVCDVKQREVGVREDGTPIMLGPRVFADLDDDLYEAMNWCVLNQVKFTQQPSEYHTQVLLVLTDDWKSSVHCTKQVMNARRKGKPVYGLHLRDGKVIRHKSA